MSESVDSFVDTPMATVVRGGSVRDQGISLIGRPRPMAMGAVHGNTRNVKLQQSSSRDEEFDERAVAPQEGQSEQVWEAARLQGLEEGRQEGYKDGVRAGQRDGYAAGKEEALAQGASFIAEAAKKAEEDASKRAIEKIEADAVVRWKQYEAKFNALLAALPSQIAQRLDASEDDMIALCMEVSVQVLGPEIVRVQAVRSVLQRAIQQLRARPLISIELHPQDLHALQHDSGWHAWSEEHASAVNWIPNADLAVGGCVVNSPEGSLDARLDTQLDTFRNLLLASREATRNSSGDQA